MECDHSISGHRTPGSLPRPGDGPTAVVAVDDTTLGPGLGGVRRLPYADEDAMVEEACRLARVMTLKNACADLPYGGAKSVLLRPQLDDVHLRDIQLRAFGRCVERLGGAYIPGVDMGTTVQDLAVVGEVTRHVACERRRSVAVDRTRGLRRDRRGVAGDRRRPPGCPRRASKVPAMWAPSSPGDSPGRDAGCRWPTSTRYGPAYWPRRSEVELLDPDTAVTSSLRRPGALCDRQGHRPHERRGASVRNGGRWCERHAWRRPRWPRYLRSGASSTSLTS